MRVIDPGHTYALEVYDDAGTNWQETLRFMKRVGDGYPFNEPPTYPGTNCQEVLRALIDRVEYLQKQVPCAENEAIINNLEAALLLFELRAARRHDIAPPLSMAAAVLGPTCPQCGHVVCPHVRAL